MIAIHGMSMPKGCLSCPFIGGFGGICNDQINFAKAPDIRRADCPLREVRKLAAVQIVNQEYSEGINWAKDEIAMKIAEKLRRDGCIVYQVTSAQEDRAMDPLFYDPCHPGEVKVRALLTVVLSEGEGASGNESAG